MDSRTIEPGLLPLFRAFMWLRLVLGLLSFIAIRTGLSAENPTLFPALSIAESVAVLLWLHWGGAQRALGHWHLAPALAVVSLVPVLQYGVSDLVYAASGLSDFGRLIAPNSGWRVSVLLLVPLVVIAWQYRIWAVLIFVFATSLLDGAFAVLVAAIGGPPATDVGAVLVARVVIFIIVGYLITHLMKEQRQRRAELAEANARVVRYASTLEALAVSQERNRLARELHDTLAHTLSGLAVQLEAADALWEAQPGQSRELLQSALTQTRGGLGEARRAIQALRAAPLEDLGLVAALRELTRKKAARGAIQATINLPDAVEQPDPEVAQVIYRVADEALENVIRHASASQVSVSLSSGHDALTLEIADDGQGFDTSATPPAGHYGLQGMRERASMVRGTLTIDSAPGAGTRLRLAVPDATDGANL